MMIVMTSEAINSEYSLPLPNALLLEQIGLAQDIANPVYPILPFLSFSNTVLMEN
jgi:hypothetical protein